MLMAFGFLLSADQVSVGVIALFCMMVSFGLFLSADQDTRITVLSMFVFFHTTDCLSFQGKGREQ